MIPSRTRCIRLALLCVLAGALTPFPALAAQTHSGGTIPCWEALLNDSYDGTISKIYPLPCYGEAIKHLPAVATIYGSEKQEIQAAEAAAAHGKLARGVVVVTTTTTTSKKATGIVLVARQARSRQRKRLSDAAAHSRGARDPARDRRHCRHVLAALAPARRRPARDPVGPRRGGGPVEWEGETGPQISAFCGY